MDKYATNIIKIKSKPISRILFRFDSLSVIYLALLLLTRSNGLPVPNLPEAKEASNFRFETYLTFQLSGFTAMRVTTHNRELLPLVFTLTC